MLSTVGFRLYVYPVGTDREFYLRCLKRSFLWCESVKRNFHRILKGEWQRARRAPPRLKSSHGFHKNEP
jgi:hypothetical protein